MDAGKALLEAIWADPDDDLPRLAYADWLEEQGDLDRAELIRVQCQRATIDGEVRTLDWLMKWYSRLEVEFLRGIRAALPERGRRGTRKMAEREAHLLQRNQDRWLSGLAFPIEFRRGFPEVIEVSASQYLESAATLERLAPVQSIHLMSFSPWNEQSDTADWSAEKAATLELVGQLAACPQLRHWVELEFVACPGCEVFDTLLSSPHLTRLRRLVARSNECGEGVRAVLDPRFASLRWLDLYSSESASGAPIDAFTDIVTAPYFAQLEHLDYGLNRLGDEQLAALVGSSTMGRLRSLGLCSSNYITAAGLRSLSHSLAVPALRHLDLRSCDLDDVGLAVLLESPLFARLSFLDFSCNHISDEGVSLLAGKPEVAGLRALVLGGTCLDRTATGFEDRQVLSGASVQALAESPYLGGVRRLALPDVRLDDELAERLARSRGLKGLQELTVDAGPGLTDKGRAVLQDRFGAGLEIRTPDE
jgi:uncharacterized protein (TIGR02996 family)